MASAKTKSFIRLDVRGEDHVYYLMTDVEKNDKETSIALTLSNGQNTWKANCKWKTWNGAELVPFFSAVLPSDLKALSKKARLDFEEFIDHTTKALTQKDMGSFSFQYSVKQGKDGTTFQWKKLLAADSIKVCLAARDSYDIVCFGFAGELRRGDNEDAQKLN
jgi:hypothetical protein